MAHERPDLIGQRVGPLHPSGECIAIDKVVDITADCPHRFLSECTYLLLYQMNGPWWKVLLVIYADDTRHLVCGITVILPSLFDPRSDQLPLLKLFARYCGLSHEDLRQLIHEHTPASVEVLI